MGNNLSLAYLKANKDKGLNIRLHGSGGSVVIKAIPEYTQSFLSRYQTLKSETLQR